MNSAPASPALIHFVGIFDPSSLYKFDCNTVTLMGRGSSVRHISVARENQFRPRREIAAADEYSTWPRPAFSLTLPIISPVIRASGGCFKACPRIDLIRQVLFAPGRREP
jgi:hypothetical protein